MEITSKGRAHILPNIRATTDITRPTIHDTLDCMIELYTRGVPFGLGLGLENYCMRAL